MQFELIISNSGNCIEEIEAMRSDMKLETTSVSLACRQIIRLEYLTSHDGYGGTWSSRSEFLGYKK